MEKQIEAYRDRLIAEFPVIHGKVAEAIEEARKETNDFETLKRLDSVFKKAFESHFANVRDLIHSLAEKVNSVYQFSELARQGEHGLYTLAMIEGMPNSYKDNEEALAIKLIMGSAMLTWSSLFATATVKVLSEE